MYHWSKKCKNKMTIKDIQDRIKGGEYRFSDHSVKRTIEKVVMITICKPGPVITK